MRRFTIYATRQPSGYVTLSQHIPDHAPCGDKEELLPAMPKGQIDPLYRRDALCPEVGDMLGVPREPYSTQRFRVVVEAESAVIPTLAFSPATGYRYGCCDAP